MPGPEVNITPTTSLQHGRMTATSSAAVLAVTSLTRSISIKALATNTVSVFIGRVGVTVTTGYELKPGDSFSMDHNNAADPIYAIAVSSSVVTWIAIT